MTTPLSLDIEAAFHDEWADSMDVKNIPVIETFQGSTAFENRWILQQLSGKITGKKILDLGCGAGEASVYFALKGAEVTALDISTGMLEKVKELADLYGVRNIKLACSCAEEMPFKSESFDIVYGNSVLHHAEIDTVLSEVSRILKPGGKAVFIEPLAHNPIINVYRKMASKHRTPDEKPLKYSDISIFNKYFATVFHKEFWFLSLGIFLWFYFIERVHPSTERYWKKIIKDEDRLSGVAKFLGRADEILLKALPILRPLCWNTTVLVTKAPKTT